MQKNPPRHSELGVTVFAREAIPNSLLDLVILVLTKTVQAGPVKGSAQTQMHFHFMQPSLLSPPSPESFPITDDYLTNRLKPLLPLTASQWPRAVLPFQRSASPPGKRRGTKGVDSWPGWLRVSSGPPGKWWCGDGASWWQLLRHAEKPHCPQTAVVPAGDWQTDWRAEARRETSPWISATCPSPWSWKTKSEFLTIFFLPPINLFILKFCSG